MRMRSGNSRVAIMCNKSTAVMRNAEGAGAPPKRSKRLSAADAASPSRATHPNPAKVTPSPKSGNARVADPVEESKASPPAPAEGSSPVPAKDELLLAKEKEIAALKEELANHVADKEVPKIDMSTEAANVAPDSKDYWIPASGKKETKKTNTVVVKHKPKGNDKDKDKPKADSTTGLQWPGYCVVGCGCSVCVAKRKEPSKTQVHDVKRVSKKPSPL